MHDLDGSNAGGQFVRTALALAALEGESVRIENVRGARSEPGLEAQHLAVFETLAEICDADVAGAELGAETIEFDPDPEPDSGDDPDSHAISGGRYRVDVGTAGSLTLLFDALLPLATRLESPLAVTATGGTDVSWSPLLDYQRFVKLPLLRKFGLAATIEVDCRGFYPRGGGRATLRLFPSRLEPIRPGDRTRTRDEGSGDGERGRLRVYATEAASLADSDVATRQAEGALERLAVDECGLDVRERVETTAASPGPGSAIVIALEGRDGLPRAGFSALGEPGKRAERVGEEAADEAKRFIDREWERERERKRELEDEGESERERDDGQPLESESPLTVDRYLADQLLVFLALAGGRVRIPAATDHVDSSVALLAEMGYDVDRSLEDERRDGGDRREDGTDDRRRSAIVSSEPS